MLIIDFMSKRTKNIQTRLFVAGESIFKGISLVTVS